MTQEIQFKIILTEPYHAFSFKLLAYLQSPNGFLYYSMLGRRPNHRNVLHIHILAAYNNVQKIFSFVYLYVIICDTWWFRIWKADNKWCLKLILIAQIWIHRVYSRCVVMQTRHILIFVDLMIEPKCFYPLTGIPSHFNALLVIGQLIQERILAAMEFPESLQ